MNALIFASGAGTRFDKLTKNIPKPLLPIYEKPLISYILNGLNLAGITKAYITLGYQGQMIKDKIGDTYQDMSILYIDNPNWRNGNLQSLLVAEQYMDKRFILCMSDHIFDFNIVKKLLNKRTNKSVVLAVDKKKLQNDDDTKVLVIEDDLIYDIGKKVNGNCVDTGFFYCSTKVFDYAKEATQTNAFELSDCIRISAKNKDAEIMDINGLFWLDIDTPEDLKKYISMKPKI
jgi:choline kinase